MNLQLENTNLKGDFGHKIGLKNVLKISGKQKQIWSKNIFYLNFCNVLKKCTTVCSYFMVYFYEML